MPDLEGWRNWRQTGMHYSLGIIQNDGSRRGRMTAGRGLEACGYDWLGSRATEPGD